MKTKKLTKKQVVEICDKVITQINECKKAKESIFLCNSTRYEICTTHNIKYVMNEDVGIYIPEFTRENAIAYASAGFEIDKSVWWETENYNDRIKFMEWIKSQYQNKKK